MESRELLARLLAQAITLPREEIARAVVEPQRKLLRLIAARADQLVALDRVSDERSSPLFGMF